MAFNQYLLLIFTLTYSCIAVSENRAIIFLQQKNPGHIIYVSIVERSNDAVVSVVGMGKETMKEHHSISMQKFNEYLQVVASSDLQSYKHSPIDGESITGLKFYTVKVQSDGEEMLLKLPTSNLNDVAQEFLNDIQSYIPK